MAGEDEAGEDVENAPRAERPSFGRRSAAAPSPGKLARFAAAAGRAEDALRTAADLKPRGLSWGLVLCIGATVVIGLLALINRPQIDEDAAYYAAAGVLIQSWLIIDNRGLWPRRWIPRGLLVVAGIAVFAGIANAYWMTAYWLTKSNDPNRFLFTTTQDAMLAFDNRWCRTWKGHVWTCGLKSAIPHSGLGTDLSGLTIAQNARVICTSNGRLVPGVSEKNYVGTCRANVPSWCLAYWNGWRAVPNSNEELSTGDPEVGPAISDSNRLRSLELYPGKCIKTIWGALKACFGGSCSEGSMTYELANENSPEFASIAKTVTLSAAIGQERYRAKDGTGVFIAPDIVLTAAHIVFSLRDDAPALGSYIGGGALAEAMALAVRSTEDGYVYVPSEVALPAGATFADRSAFDYFRSFVQTGEVHNETDIALIKLSTGNTTQKAMSLGVAWGPAEAAAEAHSGATANSAGFPRASEAGEPGYDGGDLYLTTGNLSTAHGDSELSGTRFHGLEIHSSQSGSGAWTIDPETGGQTLTGIATVFDTDNFYGGGLLVTQQGDLKIAAAFEASGVTADEAPVEYLYGSDNGELLGGGEVEAITGTYLHEIIRGDSITGLEEFAGNDRLTGGGIDHTLATAIEIGNATAHQGRFDAAGYPGVTLTDVVPSLGATSVMPKLQGLGSREGGLRAT